MAHAEEVTAPTPAQVGALLAPPPQEAETWDLSSVLPNSLSGKPWSGCLPCGSVLAAAANMLSWYQMMLEVVLSQPSSLEAGTPGQTQGMPHTCSAVHMLSPGGHTDPLLLSLQSPHPLGREHLLPRDVLQVGPGLGQASLTCCAWAAQSLVAPCSLVLTLNPSSLPRLLLSLIHGLLLTCA